MNAVARQRRANARRIAQVCAASADTPAARMAADRWALPASGAVVVPLAPAAAGRAQPRTAQARTTQARTAQARTAQDRADAVSGSPVAIDLLADGVDARAVVALTGQSVHGHVVLSDDSTAVYTSAPGFTGTDVFSYRLAEAGGRISRVTVTVSVAPHAEPASCWGALAYAA
jgi:hypothetical protein